MAVEAVANGLVVVANVANNVPQAPIANRPHNTQAKHAVEDPHIYMRARGNRRRGRGNSTVSMMGGEYQSMPPLVPQPDAIAQVAENLTLQPDVIG